jgi:hypothetical protein
MIATAHLIWIDPPRAYPFSIADAHELCDGTLPY